MHFDGWFGPGDDYFLGWFDPADVPASGRGGVSKSTVLGVSAPRPQPPVWRQLAGDVGRSMTEARNFMAELSGRDNVWGTHVEVTFTAADTPVPVSTGLGGPPRGYYVVRRNAVATIYDAEAPPGTAIRRGVHWLQASAPCVVTLYFY